MIDRICDVFEGRIVNHPEMMLEGQMGRKGRCEFSYIFNECSVILLIELKFRFQSPTEEAFSKIVAEVCAEANGLSVISVSSNCSGIHVQLDLIARSDTDTSHFDRLFDVAVFLL